MKNNKINFFQELVLCYIEQGHIIKFYDPLGFIINLELLRMYGEISIILKDELNKEILLSK